MGISKDYLYIRANNAFALAALMSRVEQYIHVVVDMLMTMKNVQVCVWFPCAKHYSRRKRPWLYYRVGLFCGIGVKVQTFLLGSVVEGRQAGSDMNVVLWLASTDLI